MLMQDLKAQIESATQQREEKAEVKAKKLQAAADFEARQTLRADEIAAIEKAIEILSSEAVSGNAEKHLPTMLQKKAASFAQLRAGNQNPAQARVAAYLQNQAEKINSR